MGNKGDNLEGELLLDFELLFSYIHICVCVCYFTYVYYICIHIVDINYKYNTYFISLYKSKT